MNPLLMKKLLFSLLLLAGMYTARGQDSLHYQYAIVVTDPANHWISIYYDDGSDTILRPASEIGPYEYAKIRATFFRALHYLNDRGYDLATGDHDHYLFRRRLR